MIRFVIRFLCSRDGEYDFCVLTKHSHDHRDWAQTLALHAHRWFCKCDFRSTGLGGKASGRNFRNTQDIEHHLTPADGPVCKCEIHTTIQAHTMMQSPKFWSGSRKLSERLMVRRAHIHEHLLLLLPRGMYYYCTTLD